MNVAGLHRVKDLEVIMEPTISDHWPVHLDIWVDDMDQTSFYIPTVCLVLGYTTRICWREHNKEDFRRELGLLGDSLASPNANSFSSFKNLLRREFGLLGDSIVLAMERAGMISKKLVSSSPAMPPPRPWLDNDCKVAKRNFRKAEKI